MVIAVMKLLTQSHRLSKVIWLPTLLNNNADSLITHFDRSCHVTFNCKNDVID